MYWKDIRLSINVQKYNEWQNEGLIGLKIDEQEIEKGGRAETSSCSNSSCGCGSSSSVSISKSIYRCSCSSSNSNIYIFK